LIDEADTGIITDYELRERYQIIYAKAKEIGDAELISATTKTLAAVTRGNKTEYFAEIGVFGDLCRGRLGYEKWMRLLNGGS
jgi:hypothetical protein